jgi:tetratricopeptide (TPR) repeat protein
LVPVIGLVQVGLQARADRYTYIPHVGVGILIAWGAAALTEGWRARRVVLAVAGCAAVAAMAVLTSVQAGYWKDSQGLFQRAVDVTVDNYWAHNNLGNAFSRQRAFAPAIEQYREALRIRPGDPMIERNYVEAQNEMGARVAMSGDLDLAAAHFAEALRLDPDEPKAHFNLGHVRAQQGKVEQAVAHYRAAARSAVDRNQHELAEQIQARLQLYEQDAAIREGSRREPPSP